MSRAPLVRPLRSAPSAWRRRLTLVELMVAIALSMILVGVVTFVWLQSNRIFTVTVNRVETYQRLRTVLDVIERDLANTSRTTDMEFYVDNDDPGNGHYDSAEDGGGDELFEVPGGGSFRVPYDPQDPLYEQNEFGLEDFDTVAPYLYAPTILSPEPYRIDAGYTDTRAYWRDEIYVRTFASVHGINIPALVHYRLVQGPDGRSLLRRRVWWLDENNELIQEAEGAERSTRTDITATISHDIADLKVAFYFKPSPLSGPEGLWYQVGAIGGAYTEELANDLVEADNQAGFLNATAPAGSSPPPLSRHHAGPDGQYQGLNALSFNYDGNARIEQPEIGPAVLRPLDEGSHRDMLLSGSSGLADYDPFDFPGVRPGDTFYVYDAVDDDSQLAVGANPDGSAGSAFPGQVLTVDTVTSMQGRIGVRFREPINFYRLMSVWLGPQGSDGKPFEVEKSLVDGPGAAYPAAGPARSITASFNVKYRVGFLPAAFLIRLSSDDRFNKRVLPMERVIRLLQQ